MGQKQRLLWDLPPMDSCGSMRRYGIPMVWPGGSELADLLELGTDAAGARTTRPDEGRTVAALLRAWCCSSMNRPGGRDAARVASSWRNTTGVLVRRCCTSHYMATSGLYPRVLLIHQGRLFHAADQLAPGRCGWVGCRGLGEALAGLGRLELMEV